MSTQPSGTSVSLRRDGYAALFLALCLLASACSRNVPAPKVEAIRDIPLEHYRLSGLVIETAPEPGPAKVGIDQVLTSMYLSAHYQLEYFGRLLSGSFAKREDEHYASLEPIFLRVTVSDLRAGHAILYKPYNSCITAKYSVLDQETGQVLFARTYMATREASSFTTPYEGAQDLAAAMNETIAAFGRDLAQQDPAPEPVSSALINGSLSEVTVTLPLTRDNLRHIVGSGNTGMVRLNTFMNAVSGQLPVMARTAIDGQKLFGNSADADYQVTVFITDYAFFEGSWLADPKFRYEADTSISKNGKEVTSFLFKTTDCPGAKPEEYFARHTEAIVKHITEHKDVLSK